MSKRKQIMPICPHHEKYEVTMINTFVFAGAEKWCPYCRHTTGLFGDYKEVNATTLRILRDFAFKKWSKLYLRAMAALTASHMQYKGELIEVCDLPEEEKARFAKIREQYISHVKVEDLITDGRLK